MSTLLIAAISCMVLALTFYTIGVFAERKTGLLLNWHALVFWCGFVFDTAGTTIMSKISGHGFTFNLHSVTGLVALLLMAFHAIWATIILIKKDDKAKQTFHRFSLFVWIAWLVPFVLGIFIGMNQ
ncbi:HsmA family protein [Candidatus Enterococcus courvalinii]|uniref:TIGR03987 family protein n=1 Tax=Candidatus Enterococcus courvalinii TaxID=2815329 RepID=A0ABS3I115_9ENTE|nr:HsmA family protein [Enterococcus sp. MSG2901]MBO0482405.1 TIGR03987 family protein [Enterococcus sp. MSG2901]